MSQKTKSKLGRHLTAVLKEMCRRADVDFDALDLGDDEWYRRHSWTREREKGFEDWLVDYLASSIEVRRELLEHPQSRRGRSLRKAAQMFCFTYGWRLSD